MNYNHSYHRGSKDIPLEMNKTKEEEFVKAKKKKEPELRDTYDREKQKMGSQGKRRVRHKIIKDIKNNAFGKKECWVNKLFVKGGLRY